MFIERVIYTAHGTHSIFMNVYQNMKYTVPLNPSCVCLGLYYSRMLMINNMVTVLVLIKLTKNPVSLRLRCGSGELYFCRYFTMFRNI